MFFRIWVLYICKLAYVLFALCMLGYFVFNTEPWVTLGKVSSILFVLLGVTGAAYALWLLFVQKKVPCPYCGKPGEITLRKHNVGVECDSCGLVHANVLTDFRFRVDPLEPCDEEWDDDDDDE